MIVKRSIWDEMRDMQARMDELFSGFLSHEHGWTPAIRQIEGPVVKELAKENFRQPLADVHEDEKEVTAILEVPGVSKEDIHINATEKGVEVSVEKKNEVEQEDEGTYRLERSYAGFYRYIPTPAGIDPNKIDASYKNGVLKLKMPKVNQRKGGTDVKVK